MQLTDEQKREVASWIASGATLSEVQQRLGDEFGIRGTYMETRFLVDDLKIVPQDKIQAEPAKAVPDDVLKGTPAEKPQETPAKLPSDPLATGKVQVRLDQIMRPGSIVSGGVTFSDGVTANWYLDQTGRFGLVPPTPGYRPTKEDLSEFQVILEQELAKQGL